MPPLDTGLAVAEPRAALRMDTGALIPYLRSHVPGFPARCDALRALQFSHGQSNPTYLLEVIAGDRVAARYVLRKKPPGSLLASAHAVRPPPSYYPDHAPVPHAPVALNSRPRWPTDHKPAHPSCGHPPRVR